MAMSTTAAPAHRTFDNTGLVADHRPVNVYHTRAPEPSRGRRTIRCTITYYTASSDECGKSDGIGAAGVRMEPGMVACDFLPLWSKVRIDGKTYVVTDRFGGGYTDKIDVFCTDKSYALRMGKSVKEVEMVE